MSESITYLDAEGAQRTGGDCIEGTGEASRDEYDLDAIAHEIAEWDPAAQAFRDTTDTDKFWASVQAHYVG